VSRFAWSDEAVPGSVGAGTQDRPRERPTPDGHVPLLPEAPADDAVERHEQVPHAAILAAGKPTRRPQPDIRLDTPL